MTIDPNETDRGTAGIFASLSNAEQEAILAEIEEIGQCDHYERLAEQREWAQEMRCTAPRILTILRQHIPNPQIQEVEKFLSSRYGGECLSDLLSSVVG